MERRQGVKWGLLGASLLGVTFGAAGCSGASITCGEGTTERDGRCVLVEQPVTCGAGTTLDAMTRRCVAPESVECGPGTVLDMASGRCRPESMLSCATGTVRMGDACVPDGSVICTGNTRFDMASGTCVLDPMACAMGTVLVRGRCVPFDDTLMADVPAAAEPDDPRPAIGGTPTAFTPPAEGATVTLGGCITPADFDRDGTIDVDVDWFNFTVSAAGLYEIRADGVGGLSAAFAVVSSDPNFAFLRVGLDLTSDGSHRQVYLPRAGAYWLAVFDSRSLALDSLEDGVAFAPRPVGTERTCYFVSVSRLPMPMPTRIAAARTTGMFPTDGSIAFYSTTTSARTVLIASENAEPSTIQEAVIIVADDTVSGQHGAANAFATAFSDILASGTSAIVVADFVYNYGLTPTTYTLDISELPEASGTASFRHSTEVYRWAWFEGRAGDVVHLEAQPSTSGNLDIAVIDPAFTRFVSNRCTGFTTCARYDAFLQLQQSGRYMVRIFNTTDSLSEGSAYDVTFTKREQTPVALTLGTARPTMLVDRWTFLELEGDSLQWLALLLSDFRGFSSANIRFYPREGERAFGELDALVAPVESADGVASRMGRIYAGNGDDMLVAIGYGAVPMAGDAVTLTAREESFIDLRPMPGMPVTRMGDRGMGAPLRYLVRGESGMTVTFRVDSGVGTLTQISRTEAPVGMPVMTPGSIVARIDAGGWVAFTLPADTTFDVNVSGSLPPYSISAGSRRYADVCGMPGARTLLTNQDDTLSPSQMIGGLPGGSFSFFGAPQTRYVVSSNGWLTFDGGYTGSTFLTLGMPTAPNRVVAPHEDDLITTVCVRESPSDVVVQWTGRSFVSASHRIEMQAVLYADGRIELVYGDGHSMSATANSAGIEDGTGFALTSGERVMAGTSTLFTPR